MTYDVRKRDATRQPNTAKQMYAELNFMPQYFHFFPPHDTIKTAHHV